MLKKILKLLGVVLLLIVVAVGGLYLKYYSIVSTDSNALKTKYAPGKHGQYVDPFIGTGGYFYNCINNFPGTNVPFSMVRLSPDTKSWYKGYTALNSSGYYYPDDMIIGFSHNRLSGTGATDGGNFRIMPVIGEIDEEDLTDGIAEKFSHENERAFPGYYAVKLDNGILAELTSTIRTGIHRYTFPAGADKHILLDVSSILGDRSEYLSKEASVSIDDKTGEISGSVRSFGTFGRRYGGTKVYFSAKFNKEFKEYCIRTGKEMKDGVHSASSDTLIVDLDFGDGLDTQVEFRLGLSYVSIENARENLKTESLHKSFDQVLKEAVDSWEKKLALIEIKGATEKQKTIFYTAMFRAFTMPTIFNDVNGQYKGFDKKIHVADGFTYYTDLSLWDTFRTLHPLYTLIAPDEQLDMVRSLVKMSEQGGCLPRWPAGYGYTGSMLGSPADMVIAETYLKGITGFDVDTAYASMKRTALNSNPRGLQCSGRRGIASYLKYGYCAADEMDEAVSKTLEYAWADDAISRFADALGNEEDAKMFKEHSRYYSNVWNPETKYFQPRNSDGKFTDKFKPLQLSYTDWDEEYTDDYVEGSALQWRYAVPFDADGLISLFGDKEYFISELNEFFAKSDPSLNAWSPGSYYWQGNEPDIHSAYLFNDAGHPDLTRKWVRWIQKNKYDTTYVGLDGNDDGATLSAWYIFSSIGLYPQAGSDIYQIGIPLFPKVVVHAGRDTLTIETENFAPGNLDVKKIILKDSIFDGYRVKHKELLEGGRLRFVLE